MVQQVNGFKLDKSHTFAVNLFDDVSRYMQVPDAYEAPEDKEFEAPVGFSGLCCSFSSPASHYQWFSSAVGVSGYLRYAYVYMWKLVHLTVRDSICMATA